MSKLFHLLGAVLPIPLFFDLFSLNFVVQKLAFIGLDGYAIGFGAPIPIGIFALFVMVFFSFLYTQRGVYALNAEALILASCLMFFIVLSIINVGIMRTLMLLLPFLCMYFSIELTKNTKIYKKVVSGYIASFSFFVFMHVLSVLYYKFIGMGANFFLFNSIFGILIYQALISYSAVLSYTAFTLLIYSFYAKGLLRKVSIYFFIFAIWFLLFLGARKAVLLDFGILAMLFSFYVFARATLYGRCNKSQVIAWLLLCIAMVAFFQAVSLSGRAINLEVVVAQRGEAYSIFLDSMFNANLVQIFLGHGGDWGGYSNIYVEMIYRLGVVSFLLYFIAFFIGLVIVRKQIKYVFNFDKSDYCFSIWFWFTVLTIALTNMFNMNLQLPYYSINLTMIMMVFLYRTTATTPRERLIL